MGRRTAADAPAGREGNARDGNGGWRQRTAPPGGARRPRLRSGAGAGAGDGDGDGDGGGGGGRSLL